VSEHPGPSSDKPVYAISVAAELAGLAVPTLRLYEEHGLVIPSRTKGGTRRYSEEDIARIRRVAALVQEGVTLSAVRMVLNLQDDNDDLSSSNRDLRARNVALHRDNERLREQAGTRDPATPPHPRRRSGTGGSARRPTRS
jgi:DNA-binding transcriptional MerR regulator